MNLFIIKRKAQSALEFTILIGFALIMISASLVVFQNNLANAEQIREESLIDQMFNILLSEIEFAVLSRPVYNRTFYLPSTLGGFSYDVDIYDGVEVVVRFMGREHVRFLTGSTEVEGNFAVGSLNSIVKSSFNSPIVINDGVITPPPPPPPPPLDAVLYVRSKYNNSVEFSGLSIGGSGAGTTHYNITSTNPINVVLTAQPHYEGSNFIEWEYCNSSAGVQCSVSVSTGFVKTVWAVYESEELIPEVSRLSVKSNYTNGTFFEGLTIEYQGDGVDDDNQKTNFTLESTSVMDLVLIAPEQDEEGNEFVKWYNCESTDETTDTDDTDSTDVTICTISVEISDSVEVVAEYNENIYVPNNFLNVHSNYENGDELDGIEIIYTDGSNNFKNITYFSVSSEETIKLDLIAPDEHESLGFIEWKGDCEVINGFVCTVVVTGGQTKNISAVYKEFEPQMVVLTVNSFLDEVDVFFPGVTIEYEGTVDGVYVSSEEKTSFNVEGSSLVSLSLVAPLESEDYSFYSWNGCNSTVGDHNERCTISTSLENHMVTAIYVEPLAYNIGDVGPADGLIFYTGGTSDWKYLEATSSSVGYKRWGCHDTYMTTSYLIGSGLENTLNITSLCDEDIAAVFCNSLNLNDFNDWFLPSIGELNLIYQNLQEEGYSSYDPLIYWSSTQDNTGIHYFAHAQNFNNGQITAPFKLANENIICARRFS